jgi:hypothetical protein
MNKTSSKKQHTSPFAPAGAAIGVAYVAAMTVLILSETGAIANDIWLYVGMGGALLAALFGFFLGYSLAVTAEARSASQATMEPAAEPPHELVASTQTPTGRHGGRSLRDGPRPIGSSVTS